MTEILLKSEQDTKRLAELVGAYLKPVDCLTLQGDLGAGKTTLMRYLIASLQENKTDVVSPSFMLMQEYDVRADGRETTLWHLDGYRLKDASEIPELGLEELLESGIVAIEWPDRFAGYLPQDRLEVQLEVTAGNERKIKFNGEGKHVETAAQISERFHDAA